MFLARPGCGSLGSRGALHQTQSCGRTFAPRLRNARKRQRCGSGIHAAHAFSHVFTELMPFAKSERLDIRPQDGLPRAQVWQRCRARMCQSCRLVATVIRRNFRRMILRRELTEVRLAAAAQVAYANPCPPRANATYPCMIVSTMRHLLAGRASPFSSLICIGNRDLQPCC